MAGMSVDGRFLKRRARTFAGSAPAWSGTWRRNLSLNCGAEDGSGLGMEGALGRTRVISEPQRWRLSSEGRYGCNGVVARARCRRRNGASEDRRSLPGLARAVECLALTHTLTLTPLP